MTNPRQDPYLWWHLAGAATLPLWLAGCLAGLAVGDPVINVWVEQGLLIVLGVTLPLGLQWLRPIYLFRLGPLALSTEALTDNQVRLLTLQRSWRQRGVSLILAVALAAVLVALYRIAPIAAATTPFASLGRTSGWLICAGGFALANWFGQTAISALGLFLARARTLERTHPYNRTKISQDFSGVLIQVGQVLPKQWLEVTAPSEIEADIPPAPADSPAAEQDYSETEDLAEEAIIEPTESPETLPNAEAELEGTENKSSSEGETTPLEPTEPLPQTAELDSTIEGIDNIEDIEEVDADKAGHGTTDEGEAETTSSTEVTVTNDGSSVDSESAAPESFESA